MKYLLSLVFISLLASGAAAQKTAMTPKPGATAATTSTTEVKDTVKLKAAFKELFPLIRPTPTMKERVDLALRRMDRMFKTQGVDSAKAHDSVMAVIRMNEDETLLYNAYSDAFTADEMKTLTTFFKTPAGKHFLEVEPRLMAARTQVDQYINRTINMVSAPMRKPREPRPTGDGTPGMPQRPRPGMRPAPGQAPQGQPVPPSPAPDGGAPEQH